MFDALTSRLSGVFAGLRGRGRISEENAQDFSGLMQFTSKVKLKGLSWKIVLYYQVPLLGDKNSETQLLDLILKLMPAHDQSWFS